MPNKIIPLENGKFYHIYNRGNNRESLFIEDSDFKYFLFLYKKYILLVADIYAWVLMSNHFHFLIRIKDKEEIGYFASINTINSGNADLRKINKDKKWKTIDFRELKTCQNKPHKKTNRKPNPSKQFSHLFNSYAKYFNKKYNRIGSLFQKGFSKKLINSDKYLLHIVYYIHNNPVHHGFTKDMFAYTWSSYNLILSPSKTILKKNEVIDWFDSIENFKYFHQTNQGLDVIKKLMNE